MRHLKTIALLILMMGVNFALYGQERTTMVSHRTFTIDQVSESENLIRITGILNNSSFTVRFVYQYGSEWHGIEIKPGEHKSRTILCSAYYLKYTVPPKNEEIKADWWTLEDTQKLWKDSHPAKVEEPKPVTNPEPVKREVVKPVKKEQTVPRNRTIPTEEGIKIFTERRLNTMSWCRYYSDASIKTDTAEIYTLIDSLKISQDKELKARAQKYLEQKKQELDENMRMMTSEIQIHYIDTYEKNPLESPSDVRNGIAEILQKRLIVRETALNRLSRTIESSVQEQEGGASTYIVGVGIITVLLILITAFVIIGRRKKRQVVSSASGQTASNTETNDSNVIVVRKTTNTILKKQNIDDVIDNDSYLKIECNSFCSDSAVRRMYLKSNCIKEIYNLYAEDLRNPENPKEDGCMVLGRWVFDKDTEKYDVTLEEIVLPGDDAIFKEFELNFGGKIKLKVSERLRKLRRDTGLQYDLTCWVHSHPGLGVFFSNSDSSVQMQLKHPSHPQFLTAMVIDILTPEQETGVFTFKSDGSINSKNDLTQMYSLEDLHKWALDSEKFGFKPEDHYDILSNASVHRNNCDAIFLNNSSIIDICSMTNANSSGLIGWAHGYTLNRRGKDQLIIKTISRSKVSTDGDLLGCVIIGAHCSIPTIRKVAAEQLEMLDFVMFYSTSDEKVTVIPVIDKQLCLDEKLYGIETLENLKIWTRRKR